MSSSSQSSFSPKKYHKMKQQINNRVLVKSVKKALSQCQNDHHTLAQTKYFQKMRLKIIQKKPIYICDEQSCMIALLSKQHITIKFQLHPFNRVSNNFYAPHNKPHIVFNCHDETSTDDTPKYPSPYHPAYHYINYQQFKERKKSVKVMVTCQHIQIKCWSIAIVNISCSGYYAPIMLIHQYSRVQGSTRVLEEPVQNILFQLELMPFLERYRLKDMRQLSMGESYLASNSDFAYYMRYQVSSQKTGKMSPFVCLDIRGGYLSNNSTEQEYPINFVFLGNVSEYSLFKRPINCRYLTKKKGMNLHKYSGRVDRDNEHSEKSHSSEEIPDYQFEQQQQIRLPEQQINEQPIQQHHNLIPKSHIVSESDENYDEEDYLRNAYLRRMQNNNQIII